MKKFILFTLAVVFIISATELHQLLKLPEMLSHFHEHKREDKNVSFWGFLKLHYLPGHPDDNDDDDDMQLPFKNQESVYHIDILSKNYQSATDFSITRYLPLKNTLHPEGMPCRQFNEIFRPPRI